MTRSSLKPVAYTPWLDSIPRINFNINLTLPREKAPEFCEQLNAIVSELEGSAFYYPNQQPNNIICRYEWHHPWKRRKYGLRLGLLLSVGDQDIKEVSAYITTNDLMENPETASRELEIHAKLFVDLQNEIVNTLNKAFERSQPNSLKEYNVVLHIEVPPMMGFSDVMSTDDKQIHVFPSMIMKDLKRVSAINVKVIAASSQGAKTEARRTLSLFCALASLANWQYYQQSTSLKWSITRPAVEFLDSLDNIDIPRLYPYRKDPPTLEKQYDNIVERIEWAWKWFSNLNDTDKEIFRPALFAYYASRETYGKQPTLTIVALTAALGSLAQGREEKCRGKLTCSECGPLSFPHNKVGDRAAITSLVIDTLHLEHERKQQATELIARVYQKQRSAYVHGAELRHDEYWQGKGLPAAFPTKTKPVGDLYTYRWDLFSLDLLTQRTLLGWLAQKNDISFDYDLFGLNSTEDLKILRNAIVDAQFFLPARRVVSISK